MWKKKITQEQYEILELYISRSIKATVRAKKVILWFLRQSNLLQSDIVMSIPAPAKESDEYRLALEVGVAFNEMSGFEPIDLHELFTLMGVSKIFTTHCGIAKKTKRKRNIILETGRDKDYKDIPWGYTIWLSNKPFQKEKITLLKFDLFEIEKTKLRKQTSKTADTRNVSEFYKDSDIPEYLNNVKFES
jgi:hypothetical protein